MATPDRTTSRGQDETQRLVEPDRRGVVRARVQEGHVTAGPDTGGHREGEPRRQALPAMGRIRADGADLGPSGRVHPLPRHRHQRSAAADAEVRAELTGALLERPGLGAAHEIEHLRHVGLGERDRLGIGRPGDRGTVQLHTRDQCRHRPAGRRQVLRSGQHHGARACQLRQPGPRGRVRVGRQRCERRDVGGIAGGGAAPLGEPGVRTGQRRPGGIVENVIRHVHSNDGARREFRALT